MRHKINQCCTKPREAKSLSLDIEQYLIQSSIVGSCGRVKPSFMNSALTYSIMGGGRERKGDELKY